MDVQVRVPKGTTSRQVLVEIKPKHLKITLKGSDKPLLDGELCEKVKVDDCFWSIED